MDIESAMCFGGSGLHLTPIICEIARKLVIKSAILH